MVKHLNSNEGVKGSINPHTYNLGKHFRLPRLFAR